MRNFHLIKIRIHIIVKNVNLHDNELHRPYSEELPSNHDNDLFGSSTT